MRFKKLFFLLFIVFSHISHAGSYDDMLIAIKNNDNATVMDLIERGMDVNTTDANGSTMLMLAARSGNLALVNSLLKLRASVNHANRFGETALSLAAYSGQLEIVKQLINASAAVNIKALDATALRCI